MPIPYIPEENPYLFRERDLYLLCSMKWMLIYFAPRQMPNCNALRWMMLALSAHRNGSLMVLQCRYLFIIPHKAFSKRIIVLMLYEADAYFLWPRSGSLFVIIIVEVDPYSLPSRGRCLFRMPYEVDATFLCSARRILIILRSTNVYPSLREPCHVSLPS